jgi:hypothetical protein
MWLSGRVPGIMHEVLDFLQKKKKKGSLGKWPQEPRDGDTCKVKNLRPLFADVDLNICASKCQVSTTLIKDQ